MDSRFKHGLFVVSLDFELYWGVRDKRSLESYGPTLRSTPKAVFSILELFEKYGIRATWATVGALFLNRREEFLADVKEFPGYQDQNLCPFRYAERVVDLEPEVHFAPELVDRIAQTEGQEVASHTFSHFYCAEEGASLGGFRDDMERSVVSAETCGIKLRSLVFPRNQWRATCLPVLKSLGYSCFRGNPRHWVYWSTPGSGQNLMRRGLRLIDSYANITGDHLFDPQDCRQHGLLNIPASAFLRPYSRRLAFLEGIKRHRIKRSMRRAAKNGLGYHLWWHPHNFGQDLTKNLEGLEDILQFYTELNKAYGLQSFSMADVAAGLDSGEIV